MYQVIVLSADDDGVSVGSMSRVTDARKRGSVPQSMALHGGWGASLLRARVGGQGGIGTGNGMGIGTKH